MGSRLTPHCWLHQWILFAEMGEDWATSGWSQSYSLKWNKYTKAEVILNPAVYLVTMFGNEVIKVYHRLQHRSKLLRLQLGHRSLAQPQVLSLAYHCLILFLCHKQCFSLIFGGCFYSFPRNVSGTHTPVCLAFL